MGPVHFFFQAEDGIRDYKVTGVQTCALPISQQWNLTIERQLPQNVFLSLAYVGNKGSRLPSSLNPVNVLNPFDPKIQALYASSRAPDPICAQTSTPPSTANCSYVPELNAVFTSDNQTLFGVKTPYPGWIAE